MVKFGIWPRRRGISASFPSITLIFCASLVQHPAPQQAHSISVVLQQCRRFFTESPCCVSRAVKMHSENCAWLISRGRHIDLTGNAVWAPLARPTPYGVSSVSNGPAPHGQYPDRCWYYRVRVRPVVLPHMFPANPNTER